MNAVESSSSRPSNASLRERAAGRRGLRSLDANARVIPSEVRAGRCDRVTQLRKLPSPAVECFNSLRKGQLFFREESCITKRFRLRRVFLELPEILLQCEVQPEVLHLAQTFQLGSKFVQGPELRRIQSTQSFKESPDFLLDALNDSLSLALRSSL